MSGIWTMTYNNIRRSLQGENCVRANRTHLSVMGAEGGKNKKLKGTARRRRVVGKEEIAKDL